MPKPHPVGTLFRIDLADGTHGYARLIRGETTLEFYDVRQPAGVELEPTMLAGAATLFTTTLYDDFVASPVWSVVGRITDDVAPYREPSYYMYNRLSRKCTVLIDGDHENTRPGTADECRELEPYAVWQVEQIEQRLRDHFSGRPNQHMQTLTDRLADACS